MSEEKKVSRISNLFGSLQASPRIQLLYVILYALFLNLFIETLSHHSLLDVLATIPVRPHVFLYNALLIALSLSIALHFKRRLFVLSLIATAWITLGISNFILSFMRITPLNSYDFVIFFQNLSIVNAYLSPVEMVLGGILVLVVLRGLLILFLRAPKAVVARRFALGLTAVLFILSLTSTATYAYYYNDYRDPITAYKEYGFVYSLMRSVIDRGISKPAAYDEKTVEHIIEDEESVQTPDYENRPNIIFLQLESFYDPDNILNVTCSEDPVPCFTALRQDCSTGDLVVPMIGGGTANVEFEVITGMNLADFGTGEYPYASVLKTEPCETVAFDLRKMGYRTHAIHNHMATFYRRNEVYPHLGFDTFTSLEYMQDYEVNQLGWCKDDVLTGCIQDALDSTPGRDFIFAISVQGHGTYTSDEPATPYPITTTGLEDDPRLKNQFEYYINQLHETDAFLGELIHQLSYLNEPVVLVVYGDHLPALNFSSTDLRSGSMLSTQYVIWSNDDLIAKQDKDLSAYQLAAYTLERCGITGGTLISFHQKHWQDEDYLENLSVLEYDMLYGDKLVYGGEESFAAVKMRMGVKNITINEAVFGDDLLTVRGDNFTKFSVIYAQGHALSTRYVDSRTLVASPTLLSSISPGDKIEVYQVSNGGTILSVSNSKTCVDINTGGESSH